MAPPLHVLVLAAGEGRRLRGAVPKVLTPLWGRPAVCWPVAAARALAPQRLVVVAGEHLPAIERALAGQGVSFAQQASPLGTGHAVLSAEAALAGVRGVLVILYGDCPLVRPQLLQALLELHHQRGGGLSVLSMQVQDPTGYGRVLRDADGGVIGIVEQSDATPEQRAVREVNAGVWALDLPEAWADLRRLGSSNQQGEVYLTDLVGLRVAAGRPVHALCWDEPSDVLGFNDQTQLAEVRELLRRRLLAEHLSRGVEIVDPATTYIDADVSIEPGARILPCTMIEGRVSIAGGCEVGPFAHLREGTVLQAGAKVGNFSETKASVLGPGVKVNHLSYVGDAQVGAGTNIGAGTITANYDGKLKHKTHIGERAFIGSGTVLVAPCSVGDDALTGAGAVVTRHASVGAGEVWVGVPARLHQRRGSNKEPTV